MIVERRSELHSSIALFTTLCIAIQNLSKGVNVVREGSPSRMRMVRRISLGMTTRPRSSILRTIPVAFIYIKSPCFDRFVMLVSAMRGRIILCHQILCGVMRFPVPRRQGSTWGKTPELLCFYTRNSW